MGHEGGQLLESFGLGSLRINLAQFGEQPAGLGHLASRLITSMNGERGGGVHRGEPHRLVQLPAVNETVVARRTLEVDPQKRLRDALGELNLVRLARRNLAPPANSLDEALGSRLG